MNIIITGASRGVGASLAKKIGRTGNNRIILLSRNKNALYELKKEIEFENPAAKVLVFGTDLRNGNDIEEFIQKINKEFKVIDILINNAGAIINRHFEQIEASEIRDIFEVNYIAPSMLIKGLMPLLKASDCGHVVNIGSMGGISGSVKFTGLAHYSSSKASLAILTECLAEEYKDTNVKFNHLALGSVQTEMLEEAFPGYKAITGADEMAEFIMNFALTANRYMNGKIIPVSLSTP